MQAEDLERKLKALLDTAIDANSDFDHLYARGQMRQNDLGQSLAANLDYLREELDMLVKEAIFPGLVRVTRRFGPAIPLEDLTEKEWMAQGVQLARQMGWKRYHTYRSDRSEPGWPDDALVRDRLILVEWKTEKGKLSDAQKEWIRALLNAQVEVYVCRPRHLDQLAEVLQRRGRLILSTLEAETRALCGLD